MKKKKILILPLLFMLTGCTLVNNTPVDNPPDEDDPTVIDDPDDDKDKEDIYHLDDVIASGHKDKKQCLIVSLPMVMIFKYC